MTPPRRRTNVMHNPHTWTTNDELDFLAGLGTGAFADKVLARVITPREILLQRYLNAAVHRSDWGAINEARVCHIAQAMLHEETRHASPA